MKKLTVFCIVLIMTAITVSASPQAETTGLKIGISKIVQHPALDSLEQGIQDELNDLGYTDASYDLQNANGDMSTAMSIAKKFESQKVDYAVGIATPTAQALANTISTGTVIYCAVTDPVGAGLVGSYDKGETNIAGISDMTPVKEQLELLNQLKPIKRLGHIYSSSEANAVTLAELTEQVCNEMGIEFIGTTVVNSSEVKQAAQTLAGKVDAFYTSTDNTVISALSALADVAMTQGIPVLSADPSSAEENPVLLSWGFNYYKMGRATGRLIDEIEKGRSTEDIPVVYMTETQDIDLLINLDVASELGISIPESLVEAAATVISNGKMEKK